MLQFTVFVQALLSVVAMTYGFGARDVAFGIISRDYYLTEGLKPRPVHYTARREMDERFPVRGKVYVYGDDQSYYLKGRIHLDYESGSDPFIWRLASSARDPEDLRKRFRQRRITHVLYSTCWPDILLKMKELTFRQKDRTISLMQEFWKRYARPIVIKENEGLDGAYVFLLAETPRKEPYDPYFSRRLPFLPGAEPLVWDGDAALQKGKLGDAWMIYRELLRTYPDAVLLEERLARVAALRGNEVLLREHLRRIRAHGWIAPVLALKRTPGG
jgi:hypothetical protein